MPNVFLALLLTAMQTIRSLYLIDSVDKILRTEVVNKLGLDIHGKCMRSLLIVKEDVRVGVGKITVLAATAKLSATDQAQPKLLRHLSSFKSYIAYLTV